MHSDRLPESPSLEGAGGLLELKVPQLRQSRRLEEFRSW